MQLSGNPVDIADIGDKRFCGVSFDAVRWTLVDADGQPLKLRSQSIDVFLALAAHSDKTVTKRDLFELVWPSAAVTDDSLVQCISEIRRALGDNNRASLKTVPRIGYQLLEDSHTRAPLPTAVGHRTKSAETTQVAWVLLLLVLLTPSDSVTTFEDTVWSTVPSIAVKAISTSGEDYQLDILARQLNANLLTSLREKTWLRVDSLTDGHPGSRAPYALTGSLDETVSGLKVSLTVTELSSNQLTWSETWSMPLEAFVRVESSILEAIADEVESTWQSGSLPALAESSQIDSISNSVAYRSLFKAESGAPRFTPEELLLARRYLEKVVAGNPQDESARAALTVARLLEIGKLPRVLRNRDLTGQEFVKDYYNDLPGTANQLWNDGSMWQPEHPANHF